MTLKLIYTSMSYLPEAQLRILADTHELGSFYPEAYDTLNLDEQTLVDAGLLRINRRNGKLTLTSKGHKFAPDVKAMRARWERFAEVAPLVAMGVEDNTCETLRENGYDMSSEWKFAITLLKFNLAQVDSVEETYSYCHPEECEALRAANLI